MTENARKFALVTGAGSGLGAAFCLRLAQQGWHVAVTDVDLVAAEKTNAALQASGGSGQVELLDVTDIKAWHRLSAKLQQQWPQLDLLINNAGLSAAGGIGEAPLEDFHDVMEVHFGGVLHGCHTMVPWMKQSAPGGHVVNVASIFGLVAPPTLGAYAASKAAVVALSETLYGELRPLGIGVTVVAPGFFDSQLVAQGRFHTDQQRQIAEQYVSQANITAEDVVEHTLAAIGRGKLYVVLGRKARWIWRLKRLMPARLARMIAWRSRRKTESTTGGD